MTFFDHPAVDTHAHVFSPFVPVPEGPGFKPSPAVMRTKQEYYGALDGHGITHGLLVQPSTYHDDNSVLLDAIASAPAANVKGIAAVPLDISDDDLAELERSGIVGVRFDLINRKPAALEMPGVVPLLEKLRERGWWLELYSNAADFPRFENCLRGYAGNVIFDGIGRPNVALGTDEPGFRRLLAFGREGRHAIKLSSPIGLSSEEYPYRDVDPFARAAIDAFGIDRCTWGSDWPFAHPRTRHNYLQMLEWLFGVVGDTRACRRVLWDNPARLFGFG